MDLIPKHISNLIESQFPDVYREKGPYLVSFLKTYFEWLEEEDNLNYHARRIFEYRDIDETAERFLVYFKETYLKNIPLDTSVKTRRLVKHSLDVYRSKGTPRAIDLLFRAVFGVGADVYFPGKDVFQLSAGEWHRPKYLEINLKPNSASLIGKEITGMLSGATAFAERLIRKKIERRLVEVLYISAINGNFQTGERINSVTSPLSPDACPTIIGSMNEIDISSGGAGFVVGDIVDVTSSRGVQGKARVTSISDVSGLLEFELLDGGYGYTANSEVLISEKNLTIDLSIGSNSDNVYFKLFETVSQPYANLNYLNSNGTFSNGDPIFTYYANNSQKGTGVVLGATAANSTAGELRVSIWSGSLNDNAIYTTANAIGANLSVSNGYFGMNATANVIGVGSNVKVYFANASGGTFANGTVVYQNNANGVTVANGTVANVSYTVGSNGHIDLINSAGVFLNSLTLATANGITANSTGAKYKIGVIDVTGTFITTANNYVYGNTLSTNGTISDISNGSGGSFQVSNDLIYEETVTIGNTIIGGYVSTLVGATAYNLPGNTAANLTLNTIGDALTWRSVEVGRIATIVGINPGEDYTDAPFITVYEPLTHALGIYDVEVDITGTTGDFLDGEQITQAATGARGLVRSSNSSHISLKRMRINDANNFIVTANSTLTILGETTGVTANITSVATTFAYPRIGINANVSVTTQTGNGSINAVSVSDSGFGYDHLETVTLTKGSLSATGTSRLIKQGTGAGFYKNRRGFLSNDQMLLDSNYWQNFSYEVRSPLNFDKYSEMLKSILHVAGTVAFGAVYHNSKATVEMSANSTVVEE